MNKIKDLLYNAKFGDKFKTRDGRLAIFIANSDDYENYLAYEFEVERFGRVEYIEDGRYVEECGKYGHPDIDLIDYCDCSENLTMKYV